MLKGHGSHLVLSITSLKEKMSKVIPYLKKHFLWILDVDRSGKNRLGTIPTSDIPLSSRSIC
jgi:hypothetical protein